MGNGGLSMLHSNYEQQVVPMGAIDDWTHEITKDNNDTTAPQKEIAESIKIEGALGIYAELINSCFAQNGEMHNHRTLYQSLSNPDIWLWYTKTGRWIVSTTQDKDENVSNGLCHCKTFGLLDPSHTKAWFVLGEQGKFRRQMQVVASKTIDEELRLENMQVSSAEHNNTDGETQSTQDAVPSVVKFQGVTGESASKINGVYKCKTKKHPTKQGEIIEDKKIFYRHRAQSGWRYDSILLQDSEGRWIVLQDNHVLAYGDLVGLADPCDVKRWHIRRESNASKCSSLFSVQLSADVKRGEGEDPLDLPLRTRPAFRTSIILRDTVKLADSIFADTPKRANSIFADSDSDANETTYFSRKRAATFSEMDTIKKKITPYMKALEKLKSRNVKKCKLGYTKQET